MNSKMAFCIALSAVVAGVNLICGLLPYNHFASINYWVSGFSGGLAVAAYYKNK